MLILICHLGLANFAEPNFLVYDIESPKLEEVLEDTKRLLHIPPDYQQVVQQSRVQRQKRIQLSNEALLRVVRG